MDTGYINSKHDRFFIGSKHGRSYHDLSSPIITYQAISIRVQLYSINSPVQCSNIVVLES